jgi:hypothetical protein
VGSRRSAVHHSGQKVAVRNSHDDYTAAALRQKEGLAKQ